MLILCEILQAQYSQKPRIIITTDINNVGGDPDDKQSMAHLFMYANEVEIVAIIPDYWNGKGIEATNEAIDAYERDYFNNDYTFQEQGYPSPNKIRSLVAQSLDQAKETIFIEARKLDQRPLYVLVWGGMTVIKEVLMEAPKISEKIRVLSIATHIMARNPNNKENAEVDHSCKKINWNGRGRNSIFNDKRFKNIWWIENDWAYNGMFMGPQPREFLKEIKNNGNLGYFIWEVVQPHSWAHYFRVGDTPTLLYLLETIDHDDPSQFSWGGKFVRPFPEQHPNYWIDDAGTKDWDYHDPCNSWALADSVYKYRIKCLMDNREEMYEAFRSKMKGLYNK